MVAYTCTSSVWEADAGGSGVQGHPGTKWEPVSKQQQNPTKTMNLALTKEATNGLVFIFI